MEIKKMMPEDVRQVAYLEKRFFLYHGQKKVWRKAEKDRNMFSLWHGADKKLPDILVCIR